MKKLLFLAILLLTLINFYGQLNVGDIAIIGMNTDAEDSFSFITLRDIPGSEKIYFTDRGVKNSTTWNVAIEGTTLFTAPVAGIPIGTIIRIEETAADVLTITGVTGATISIVQGSFNLAGGDQNVSISTR